MKNPFARDRQVLGQQGEDTALALLKKSGLSLLARNYRCKGGEIDLIMEEGEYLVFIEVRYRKNRHFGGAAASVTGSKQKRLIIAAQHYLLTHGIEPACRFDVVAIDGSHPPEWIKNAFDLSA
ncbi:MAG: YraN family protein [bacterium]